MEGFTMLRYIHICQYPYFQHSEVTKLLGLNEINSSQTMDLLFSMIACNPKLAKWFKARVRHFF